MGDRDKHEASGLQESNPRLVARYSPSEYAKPVLHTSGCYYESECLTLAHLGKPRVTHWLPRSIDRLPLYLTLLRPLYTTAILHQPYTYVSVRKDQVGMAEQSQRT